MRPNPKSTFHSLLPWLPAILWMMAIFYFAARPSPLPQANGKTIPSATTSDTDISPDPAFHLDIPWEKLAHMGEYAGLCLWFYVGFASQNRDSERGEAFQLRRTLSFAFIASLLYAVSDEIHQIPVTGRGFELLDIGLDAIGAILMIGILFLINTFAIKDV